MPSLWLGAIICNISVSVGENVTHLTDSYDVPHLPAPTHIPTLLEHTYYKNKLLKPNQKQLLLCMKCI